MTIDKTLGKMIMSNRILVGPKEYLISIKSEYSKEISGFGDIEEIDEINPFVHVNPILQENFSENIIMYHPTESEMQISKAYILAKNHPGVIAVLALEHESSGLEEFLIQKYQRPEAVIGIVDMEGSNQKLIEDQMLNLGLPLRIEINTENRELTNNYLSADNIELNHIHEYGVYPKTFHNKEAFEKSHNNKFNKTRQRRNKINGY